MGMRREGKRAWKAGRRVCWDGKRERKMIVCVCQWELSPLTDSVSVPLILSHAKASLFIQSFRDPHLHCMKIPATFFHFLYISTRLLLLLWCLGMFLMLAHFHCGEGGVYFFQNQGHASRLFICFFFCISELNIKNCKRVHTSFSPYTVSLSLYNHISFFSYVLLSLSLTLFTFPCFLWDAK